MYSNAFNFTSFLDGGVDLRTGQYTVSCPLVTLRCFYNDEISHTIGLSFSIMDTSDNGFGAGWGLSGLSQYSDMTINPASPTMTLSTGETYQVIELNDRIELKDKKLNDVYVYRVDARTVNVVYKKGIIETLRKLSDGTPYKLTRIQFENGEYHDFQYLSYGPLTSLSSITDSVGNCRLRCVSLNNDGVINTIYSTVDKTRVLCYDHQ